MVYTNRRRKSPVTACILFEYAILGQRCNARAQARKVGGVNGGGGAGRGAVQQQGAQRLARLFAGDELAQVFVAAAAVQRGLLLHEGVQRVRKGDAERVHVRKRTECVQGRQAGAPLFPARLV